MVIAFARPAPSAEEWAEHQKDVKRCRGIACYQALVDYFGTESPDNLEKVIDGRQPYGLDAEKSYSNKYRNWRKGISLPSEDTVAKVFEISNGELRLDAWRDLPLWELLARDPPTISRLHQILENSTPRIKKLLFGEGFQDEEGEWHHHPPLERSQVLAIRDQQTLDAFITLLCLSRKGELMDNPPQFFLPVRCAFDIFPKVVIAHQPLQACWEALFACLDRTLGRREVLGGLSIEFSKEKIISEMKRSLADYI